MIELVFTEKDMQAGRILDAGWYPTRITKVYLKQKNNKPAGDMNLVADMEVVGGSDGNGPAEGVYVKSSYFASSPQAVSAGLFKALGIEVKAGERINLENITNIDVDAFLKPGDEYQGTISNEAKNFAPLGTHTKK